MTTYKFTPRFRVISGETIALGPGKIALLLALSETGSINEAAKKMEMSYMRAWTLVRTMNRCFVSDLVVSKRGGRAGGGAELTPLGWKVLGIYREMERVSEQVCDPLWVELKGHLQN